MELFFEPRLEALSKISKVRNEPEMTEFESAFICGLIKSITPKKILEIGVAAGGTTAIILQCLNDLGLHQTEFVSVDLNKKFYRKDSRDTGFLATEIKKLLPNLNHRFVLGDVIANTIEEIGGQIDLVILDTVHSLPGELLDFPVVLPFLSKECIVVLHDIAYYHYSSNEFGIATQVLLDCSTGQKIVPLGKDKFQSSDLANIGAIRISNDTIKYIDSVFYAMLLPWSYVPDEQILEAYRKFYVSNYDSNLVKIFDLSVELNKKLLLEKNRTGLRLKRSIKKIIKHIFSNRN